MNNKVWIYEKNNKNIINYFSKKNIFILDFRQEGNRKTYLINEKDYFEVIKTVLYDFEKVDDFGFNKIKKVIKSDLIFYFSFIVFITMICLISNIILSIDVFHSDRNLRDDIKYDLNRYGISKFSIKKDFNQLQKIKKQILKDNESTLEWLEIESIGMKYIVKVEERIIPKIEKKNKKCNVVAKKSGSILSYSSSMGQIMVSPGDYVKQGDILSSGEIVYKDNIVNNVCANGKFFAEVWYKIEVNVPVYYIKENYTGKNRWNIAYEKNGKIFSIFKSRLKKSNINNYKIFSIFNKRIYFQREKEYEEVRKKYSYEEIIDMAVKKGLSNLKVSIGDKNKIITKKVLKKNVKDSKMYLELFVSIKEEIGKTQIIE